MTATASFRRIAIGLMLLSIISGVSLAYATLENGYKNDNSFLTDISESTRTENGYKISIIINPDIVGIHAKENGYKLDLAICPQGVGGALKENGYRLDLEPEKLFPAITDESARHDVAITNVAHAKTVVCQGFSLNVSVTAGDNGDFTETFDVTAYANATAIQTKTLTLTSGNTITLTYTWNAAGFAKGNYSISAYAWPVPGETSTADNNFTDGWVFVSMVGDLTGGTPNVWDFVPDGKVSSADVSVVARCFGSSPDTVPPLRWEPNCDLNNNGHVDGTDVATVARHFGESDP